MEPGSASERLAELSIHSHLTGEGMGEGAGKVWREISYGRWRKCQIQGQGKGRERRGDGERERQGQSTTLNLMDLHPESIVERRAHQGEGGGRCIADCSLGMSSMCYRTPQWHSPEVPQSPMPRTPIPAGTGSCTRGTLFTEAGACSGPESVGTYCPSRGGDQHRWRRRRARQVQGRDELPQRDARGCESEQSSCRCGVLPQAVKRPSRNTAAPTPQRWKN